MSRNKQAITRAVLAAIEQHSAADYDQAIIAWWSNIRAAGGMRLTSFGHSAFQAAELQFWSIELEDIKLTMDKKLLLDLDRKLQFPYFIDYKNKAVVFYSSKEAMLARIYNDLPSFIKNYG